MTHIDLYGAFNGMCMKKSNIILYKPNYTLYRLFPKSSTICIPIFSYPLVKSNVIIIRHIFLKQIPKSNCPIIDGSKCTIITLFC